MDKLYAELFVSIGYNSSLGSFKDQLQYLIIQK